MTSFHILSMPDALAESFQGSYVSWRPVLSRYFLDSHVADTWRTTFLFFFFFYMKKKEKEALRVPYVFVLGGKAFIPWKRYKRKKEGHFHCESSHSKMGGKKICFLCLSLFNPFSRAFIESCGHIRRCWLSFDRVKFVCVRLIVWTRATTLV